MDITEDNKRLKEEHTTLVGRIYEVCNIIKEQNQIIIKQNWSLIIGALLGITAGFFLAVYLVVFRGWLI